MTEYSLLEVAPRAGVDSGYVEDLIRLGVLAADPGCAFSSGDVGTPAKTEG